MLKFPSPLGPEKQATGEVGISGTTNLLGQLLTETNEALFGTSGYGQAGTRTWGTFEQMRRTDPAVAETLEFVLAPIRGASVSVKAPDLDDDENLSDEEKAIGDFVEESFLRWTEPSWPELAGQLVKGFYGSGFSVHEPVFDVREDDRLPGGKGYYLRKLAQRLPNTLHYNAWVEERGELVALRQRGVRDGQWVNDLLLPADRIILCTWDREGNNYAGYSAFRAVYYLVKVREQLLRIIGISHQRESCGIPIATMEKDTPLTTGQRAKLRRLLENCIYHENAAVVLPPGVKVDWWTANNASSRAGVIETWRQLGIVIQQVGQAQQMSLGTNDTGSRAVGQVHSASKGTVTESVVKTILGALNGIGSRPYNGLNRKMVIPNWGEQKRYPLFEISLPRAELPPQDFATAVKTGLDAKAITWRHEDENKFRERVGLDPIDELERKELQAEAAQKALEIAQAAPKPGPFGGKGDDGKAGAAPPRAGSGPVEGARAPGVGRASSALSARAPGEPFVPGRQLFAHEAFADFGAMDDLLSQAREKFQREARPLLVELLVRAMPQVKEAMADGDPSEVVDLQLDTSRLSTFVSAFLEQLRAEGYRHVQAEQDKSVKQVRKEHQAGEVAPAPTPRITASSAGARIEAAGKKPAFDVERLMRAQRDLLLRRMKSRIIDDLQREAIRQVRTGGDSEQIVSNVVRDALDSNALKQDAGLVVTSAFNIGREEFAREIGGVSTVHLSAVLDSSTCMPCSSLDGAEFDFGSAEHEAHVPPLTDICDGGDLCRCVLIYDFDEQATPAAPAEAA